MQIIIIVACLAMVAIVAALVVLSLRDRSNREEVERVQALLLTANERVDRLTEALANSKGVDLILPQPKSSIPLEPSSGWFDKKPIRQIQIKGAGQQ